MRVTVSRGDFFLDYDLDVLYFASYDSMGRNTGTPADEFYIMRIGSEWV